MFVFVRACVCVCVCVCVFVCRVRVCVCVCGYGVLEQTSKHASPEKKKRLEIDVVYAEEDVVMGYYK